MKILVGISLLIVGTIVCPTLPLILFIVGAFAFLCEVVLPWLFS